MNEKLAGQIEKINSIFGNFSADATRQAEAGNKAAGRRARVLSGELSRELKTFRAMSTGRAE